MTDAKTRRLVGHLLEADSEGYATMSQRAADGTDYTLIQWPRDQDDEFELNEEALGEFVKMVSRLEEES